MRQSVSTKHSLLTLLVIFFMGYWILRAYYNTTQELDEHDRVSYVKLRDEANTDMTQQEMIYPYNKNIPLIFVGGVPRSGTTLMRAMLDAHPKIRCGEETRVIPRIISAKHQWISHKLEGERLKNAGITNDIIDSAIRAFILEVIVRHGKPAEHLCNKDPIILRYSNYVHTNLFPNSKFVLMLRDGRATVHSIISRNVTITGFDLTSYRECLKKWSVMIEQMYDQCQKLGSSVCLPVHYEQLVLHPEQETRKILKFLDIEWNDTVINHEKYIGDEIAVSKVEKSTDQIVKPVNLNALSAWVGHIPRDVQNDMETIAPMLRRLGYDPRANPPNYGTADLKIQQNTFDIQENSGYWNGIGEKYSLHKPPKNI